MWKHIAPAVVVSALVISCSVQSSDASNAGKMVALPAPVTTTVSLTVVQTQTITADPPELDTPSLPPPGVEMFACASANRARLFQITMDDGSFSGTATVVEAVNDWGHMKAISASYQTWGTIAGGSITVWIADRPPLFGTIDDVGFTLQEAAASGLIVNSRCDRTDMDQWNWVVDSFRADVASHN